MPFFHVTLERTVVRPTPVRQFACVTVEAAEPRSAGKAALKQAGSDVGVTWRDWPGTLPPAGSDAELVAHAVHTLPLD